MSLYYIQYQNMDNKRILLATFTNENGKVGLINYIITNHKVQEDKIRVYTIQDNEQLILTYSIEIELGNKINLFDFPETTLIVHKKGSTIYTINALNKIIESNNDLELGNIDYKNIKIDWHKYNDKFLSNKNGKLKIYDIKRILS